MTTPVRLAARLSARFRPRASDRHLLPEGRLSGPMPWVLAIMLFMTTLATAGGIALGTASRQLGSGLSDRATVQVVAADTGDRDAQAAAALGLLRRHPAVRTARPVPATEIATLLKPWLGVDAIADLPVPALIDVTLAHGAADLPALAGALRTAAPAARLDDQQAAFAPLAGLVDLLRWIALALVLLMTLATACTVMLAATAALDTHRTTIDVLHLLGATDVQIARLFQRRIALDTLFAGILGLAVGVAVLWLVGRQLAGLGSDLIGTVQLPGWGWAVLAILPVATTALAMLAARGAILRALGRML